jgi:hypothetical protein
MTFYSQEIVYPQISEAVPTAVGFRFTFWGTYRNGFWWIDIHWIQNQTRVQPRLFTIFQKTASPGRMNRGNSVLKCLHWFVIGGESVKSVMVQQTLQQDKIGTLKLLGAWHREMLHCS